MKKKTVDFKDGVLTVFSFDDIKIALSKLKINKEDVREIIIPTIKPFILNGSFSIFPNLTRIQFLGQIGDFNDHLFDNCKSLKEIILPSSISAIGNLGSFTNCTSLEKIILPEGLHELTRDCFTKCCNLKDVTFSNSIKVIGAYSFSKCHSLENIVFPDSVKEIKLRAFYKCKSLKNVVLSKDLEVIGDSAFADCSSLEEIVIPEGVTKINDYAFNYCKSLKRVVLPSSLVSIGRYAFAGCENLEEIVIKEGLETIQEGAFAFCKSLKNIDLPNTLRKIDSYTFKECDSLKEVIIPEKVNAISTALFYKCISLENVILPDNLKEINTEAFCDCTNLKQIVIPDSVTHIRSEAFSGCCSLKEVVLSNNLSKIDTKCFEKCSALEEIVIPEGIMLICDESFSECESLQNISFPNTLTRIRDRAFRRCKSLREIVFPKDIFDVSRSAFEGCHSLKKVTLPSNLNAIDKNLFTRKKGLEEIVLCEGTKAIPSGKFCGCTSLSNIVLPNSLKTIGNAAFKECTSLQRIVIPEGVKELSKRIFHSCSSLEKVILPDSIKAISDHAFSACYSLKKFKITSNIKYISSDAFSSFSDLKLILDVEGENKIINVNKYIFRENTLGCLLLNEKIDKDRYSFYLDGKYYEFNSNDLFNKSNSSNNISKLDERYYILLYFWNLRNKFLPHRIIIENMPIEDIDLFYLNGNCNKWAEILRSTNIEIDSNKGSLFKLCYVLGVFQENGAKRDEAVEYIKKHILSKMNEYEIHSSFDGLDLKNGFDPMWAEFFMKYYKDNPNFMYDHEKKVDLLAASYNNFKLIKEYYPNKVVNTNRDADILLPEHVMTAISNVHYDEVEDDNELFALQVGRYGYSQEQFEELQEWFDEGKNIKKEDLKIFISKDNNKKDEISYKLLEKDDSLGAVLGNITNCCQVIGGAGESCVEYGMTMPNSKFMIFNYNDSIIGQAWVWYDEINKVICLDNIEVPLRYCNVIKRDKKTQKSFIDCLKRMGENFINEMRNHGLEVNRVTIGKGYNDINYILKSIFESDTRSSSLRNYGGYSDAYEQYVIVKK